MSSGRPWSQLQTQCRQTIPSMYVVISYCFIYSAMSLPKGRKKTGQSDLGPKVDASTGLGYHWKGANEGVADKIGPGDHPR